MAIHLQSSTMAVCRRLTSLIQTRGRCSHLLASSEHFRVESKAAPSRVFVRGGGGGGGVWSIGESSRSRDRRLSSRGSSNMFVRRIQENAGMVRSPIYDMTMQAVSDTPPPHADFLLDHHLDPYGGVIVDHENLPSDVADFSERLTNSLKMWNEAGVGGVWLKVPLVFASLVGSAVEQGFVFHHAEPEYVMLTAWLEDSPSRLPTSASTHLGVGAFVLNSKNEMLVVRELKGPAAVEGFWKMPTGHVDIGEDLCTAAVREVFEETGVRTEFKSVLGMRHAHNALFGKGDMFFLCALRPVGSQDISACTAEIAEAKWMPLEQFMNNPMVVPDSYVKYFNKLCASYADGSYDGIQMLDRDRGVREKRNKTTKVYSGTFDEASFDELS